MAKPTIVTRAGKGSALTWTEGDTNLTNLRDATIAIKAGTGGTDVVSDLNGTVTLVAGTNISLSGDNTAKTVTINSTASGGATTLDELSDVVITAAATGDLLYFNGTNWVDTAASTLTVGTADVATAVTLTATDTTNAEHYIAFVDAATGNELLRTDVGLSYNPSTGVLTATSFAGALTGNASSATYASAVTLTADNTTAATNYPLFANAATGNLSPRTDTGFTYNPSTGILTATSFAGALNGTVGVTTQSTGRFTSLQMNSLIETGGTASTASGAYTYAPNAANGTVQTLAMSTSTALTFNGFTSPVAGQSLTIIVTNNATVTTISSTMKWAGGLKTLTGTTGAIDIISVYYDGTNYYASISKGFA